jgi:cbb3-type cytochrome oxidase subunit 3
MKEYFANVDAGIIALLFFFGFFIAMLAWLFRPGSKAKYKEYGNIPLKGKDDE